MHEKTIEKLNGIEADLRGIELVTVHTSAAINTVAGARQLLLDDEVVRANLAKEKAEADAKRLADARELIAAAGKTSPVAATAGVAGATK